MDVQPGGAFCTLIKAPDGANLSENEGCYLEVIENEHLIFTTALTPDFALPIKIAWGRQVAHPFSSPRSLRCKQWRMALPATPRALYMAMATIAKSMRRWASRRMGCRS
jgi:hypothetical protein